MIPWALTALGHALPSLNPTSILHTIGDSIAQPITSSHLNSITDDIPESKLELRSSEPLSREPGSFSIAWKIGQNGYNISIPHNTCSSSIVGKFTSPSGAIFQNATFETINQSINQAYLTGQPLYYYLLPRAQALQANLDNVLAERICDLSPGGSRSLLTRVDPLTIDGYWTATIINSLAGGGIAIGGIYGAISNNLTYIQEASALAGVGALEYILYRLIDRLQHKRIFSNLEASIMSVFITAGENIWAGMQSCGSSPCRASCMSGGAFLDSLSDLWRSTKTSVLGCCGGATKKMGSFGSFGSSANLVAQGNVDVAEMC